jgi:hypothetical protein
MVQSQNIIEGKLGKILQNENGHGFLLSSQDSLEAKGLLIVD